MKRLTFRQSQNGMTREKITAMMMCIVWFLPALLNAVTSQEACQLRLIRDLLHPSVYDTSMRPVRHANETADVTMSTALFQIMDLSWADPHFTWNPDDYCGIKLFTVAAWRIWRPDVVLYNSISEENTGFHIFADTDIKIYNDGVIKWPTLAIIRASCRVKIRNFPFDRQDCVLVFSSWTEDVTKMMLLPAGDSAQLDNYVESGEWTLLGMPAELNLNQHAPDEDPYAEVIYTVMIERKPLFFMFNLVLPCILLMAVGILTFCLDPATGEKIPLCTTILLTMMLFQVMLSDSMPPTSDVIPLLTQFFAVSVILLVLSTVCAVMVMALFDNALRGREVPAWLKSAVWRVSWFVCLRSRAEEMVTRNTTDGEQQDTDQHKDHSAHTSRQPEPEHSSMVIFEDKWNTLKKNSSTQQTRVNGLNPPAPGEDEVAHLAENITQMTETYVNKQERKKNLQQIKKDWQTVINVIDRSLLYLFSLATVIVSLAILLSASF